MSSNSFKNEIYWQTILLHIMCTYLNMCKQMTVKMLLLHNNTWNQLTLCKQMINS